MDVLWTNDTTYIVIAQDCNRRCTFCKVHYLDCMQYFDDYDQIMMVKGVIVDQ